MLSRQLTRTFETKFLITGGSGQIGKLLIPYMTERYGKGSVVVTDLQKMDLDMEHQPEFHHLDVVVIFIQNKEAYLQIVSEVKPTQILHLAAFLSAKAEMNLEKSFDVNIIGVQNALEAARRFNSKIYIPSSIAAFGPSSPRINTPNECILQPTTVYGIAKVYAEMLGNYYHTKFGVDFRSIRYPGAISASAPGGGTTDYAIDIFYELLKNGKYNCFLEKDTMLPMMYMDDLLRGTCELLDIPNSYLTRRVYNLAAISFTPGELTNAIKKYLPDAEVAYVPDVRQKYADSWPMSLDDIYARRDWGWSHQYDLDTMVRTMIKLVGPQVTSRLQEKTDSPNQTTGATGNTLPKLNLI